MSEISKEQWREFVAQQSEANFLQSIEWAELHENLGSAVIRRGICNIEGTLVAGWQGIIKDARRGRYLEVPGAPLIDWNDKDMVNQTISQLRVAAQEHNCVFVRIRPQLFDTREHQTTLAKAGFKKAPFHLHAEHTNILDLTKSEEDILAAMRRQTRYEVRRSDKQDIHISVRSGKAAIEEFYNVQVDTAARQGFVPSAKSFLIAMGDALAGNLRVYRAEKDGKLLNMAIVLWSGEEADYFEAASTPESRSFAGAYGLQWQAIRDAKSAGKTRYNFWGIAYSNDPKHRYAGVTTFKRGFGGDDVTYVPAHDLIVHPLGYIKNWIIETVRRKKRRL